MDNLNKISAVINTYFECRNILYDKSKELIAEDVELLESQIVEIEDTFSKANLWWEAMKKKYNWESATNCYWRIDLATNKIYLTDKQDI